MTSAHPVGIHWCDLAHIPGKWLRRQDLAWTVFYPDEFWSLGQFGDTALGPLAGRGARALANEVWPSVWATHTVNQTRYRIEPNSHASRHWVIMNRKPRPHRVDIMSRFAHSNVLEHSHYSWMPNSDDYGYSTLGSAVPVSVLDSHMVDESDMWSVPAAAYADSAAAIVLESSEDTLFVTEKTFMPIFQRRLPLIYAARGHYNMLTAWGFEFPREINYNWDGMHNTADRRCAFVSEIQRLTERYTPAELAALYRPYAQRNLETLAALAAVRPPEYEQWRKTVPLRWAESARHFIEQIEMTPRINTL